MTDPRPAAPALTPGKRVLFSLVLALLVFGVLEGAAQLYLRTAKGYTGDSFLQYEFDPYKNFLPFRNWVDSRGVRHNAQGFRRDGDVARVKPEGTFRVFLMGASTAYGTGGLWPHLQRDYAVLDNSETIDAYLEQMLEAAMPGRDVEVINAGIPSQWTHHELIYLNQTILGYDPDVVLFLDGLNDHFYYNANHDQFADFAYGDRSNSIMGRPTLSSLITANAWWLFRQSAAVHVAVRAAEGLKAALRPSTRTPIVVDQAVAALPGVFQRNALAMIRRNAAILQLEDVHAVFMLQPLLALERERVERMPEVERRMFEFNLESMGTNYEEFIRTVTPTVAGMIGEAVTPMGASFLDLTNIYDDAEGQMFTDYAHLTPPANRILAQHVMAELVRRGWVPGGPAESAAPAPAPADGAAPAGAGHGN